MTRFCRSRSILLASVILCFGISCKQEGPAEQAGKKVDEAVEKAKEKGQEAVEKVEEAAK